MNLFEWAEQRAISALGFFKRDLAYSFISIGGLGFLAIVSQFICYHLNPIKIHWVMDTLSLPVNIHTVKSDIASGFSDFWEWLLFVCLFLLVCGSGKLIWFRYRKKIDIAKRAGVDLSFSVLAAIISVGLLFEYPFIWFVNLSLAKNIEHWQFEYWRNIAVAVSAFAAFGATIWRSKISETQMQEQVEQGKRTERQLSLAETQIRNTESQIELSRQTLAETQTNNLAKLLIDASKLLEEAETISAYFTGLTLMEVVYKEHDSIFAGAVIQNLVRLTRAKEDDDFSMSVLCFLAGKDIFSSEQINLKVNKLKVDSKFALDDIIKFLMVFLQGRSKDISLLEMSGVHYCEEAIENGLEYSPVNRFALEFLCECLRRKLDKGDVVKLASYKYRLVSSKRSDEEDECAQEVITKVEHEEIDLLVQNVALNYVKFLFKLSDFSKEEETVFQDCKFYDCKIYKSAKICSGCEIEGLNSDPSQMQSCIYGFALGETISIKKVERVRLPDEDLYPEKSFSPQNTILVKNTIFKAEPMEGRLFRSKEDKQNFERFYNGKNAEEKPLLKVEKKPLLKVESCYYDSVLITDDASRVWFETHGVKPDPKI